MTGLASEGHAMLLLLAQMGHSVNLGILMVAPHQFAMSCVYAAHSSEAFVHVHILYKRDLYSSVL